MMAVHVCMLPVYLILYTLFLIFLMDIDLMDDIYKYIYFNPSFLLNVDIIHSKRVGVELDTVCYWASAILLKENGKRSMENLYELQSIF